MPPPVEGGDERCREGVGRPRGRPPLDRLRSPPPSYGGLLTGLGAHSHGAFGANVSGTSSLFPLLLGLNHVSVALGLTLVYFHVGHLQTNIPPKPVEIISCVYTKIWEEERGNSKLPRLCHQEIDRIRIDIS